MKLNKKQAETIVQALHYWAREIESDPDFESGLTEKEVYSLAESFTTSPGIAVLVAKYEEAWPVLDTPRQGPSHASGIQGMDPGTVELFLIELYSAAKDGQASVESFCETYLPGWERSYCQACETDTPTVPGGETFVSCAVCSSQKRGGE